MALSDDPEPHPAMMTNIRSDAGAHRIRMLMLQNPHAGRMTRSFQNSKVMGHESAAARANHSASTIAMSSRLPETLEPQAAKTSNITN